MDITLLHNTGELKMMNPRTCSFVASSSLIISALVLFAFCDLGFCRVERNLINLGAIRDIAPNEIHLELETLARFALQQHNKNQKSLLKFSRLVKAKEQVVAGMMYYFTLEAADDAGNTKVYEAKVWVKPWINFKQLQDFKVSHEQSV